MIAMKFDTEIKGSSKADNHTDWIDILSISFGTGRGVSYKSGGADRTTSLADFQDITMSRMVDIASADLFAQSIYGESLGKATIDFIRSDGDSPAIYMQLILHEPIITAYNVSGGSDSSPIESLTINFTKISLEYNDDGVDQSQQKTWDRTTSKAIAA